MGAEPGERPSPPEMTVQSPHQGIRPFVGDLCRFDRVHDADVGSGKACEEADDLLSVNRAHNASGEHPIGELPPGIRSQSRRHSRGSLAAHRLSHRNIPLVSLVARLEGLRTTRCIKNSGRPLPTAVRAQAPTCQEVTPGGDVLDTPA